MEAIDVKNAARRFGADLVGIAPLSRFDGVAPQNDPRSIFPQGKTMIVIGRRIPRGAVRGVESGNSANVSFTDFGFYMLEDQYLAKCTYDLVIWMENQGFEAVPMFGYDVEATAGVLKDWRWYTMPTVAALIPELDRTLGAVPGEKIINRKLYQHWQIFN